MTAHEAWTEIHRHMQEIISTENYWHLRRRYASPEQEELEAPAVRSRQTKLWFEAKELYCSHRDDIHKYMGHITDGTQLENYKIMEKLVDQESTKALEELISQD